uniref:Uncharacterized protein n=1 Tax=Romanomermis culicivorax TaxID=13658 RepID=A0A915L0H4_ROMCU
MNENIQMPKLGELTLCIDGEEDGDLFLLGDPGADRGKFFVGILVCDEIDSILLMSNAYKSQTFVDQRIDPHVKNFVAVFRIIHDAFKLRCSILNNARRRRRRLLVNGVDAVAVAPRSSSKCRRR